MVKTIKNIAGQILLNVAPSTYKKLFYKNLLSLNWDKVVHENRNPELLYLPYFLNPDDVFFDVGANRGEYLIGANRILKPENIHAFEPIPILNRKLNHLFASNHVHALAFSDSAGTARFKIPVISGKEYDTRGTLKLDHKEVGEAKSIEFDVLVETIDRFIEAENITRLDFLKIDVEGFEENVLLGAKLALDNYRPMMIVEIEKRHHQKPIKDIVTRVMDEHKYSCLYFDLANRKFSSIDQDADVDAIQDETHFKSHPALYINNFIFVPTEKTESGFLKALNQKLANDMQNANG